MEFEGKSLETIRNAKGFSMETLAKKTKIHTDYLKAIEDGSLVIFDIAAIYKRNFIRTYALALDLPPKKLLTTFNIIDTDSNANIPPRERSRRVFRSHTHNIPQVIRTFLLLGITATLLSYLGMQIKHILEPPNLVIFSPEDGYVTKDRSLTITGETDPEVTVSINGETIKNGENGGFTETLQLNGGINTITIRAQKKHGKDTTITKYVTVTDVGKFSLNH